MTTLISTGAIYLHASIIAFAIILANTLIIIAAIVFITKKFPKKEDSIMTFEKGVELLFTSNLKGKEQKREEEVILHVDENPAHEAGVMEILNAASGEASRIKKNATINMVLTRYPKRGEVSIPCAHDLKNLIQGKSIKRGVLALQVPGKTHAAGLLAANTDALVIKVKAGSLLGDGSDFSDMKKATFANLIKKVNTKYNRGVVLLIDEFDKIKDSKPTSMSFRGSHAEDPKFSDNFLTFIDDVFPIDGKNTLLITGNEKEWFTKAIQEEDEEGKAKTTGAESSKNMSHALKKAKEGTGADAESYRLVLGRMKAGGGFHKFSLLEKESAKSALRKCLLENQNYKNCTLTAQLQIQTRIEKKIDSNEKEKTFSLRDLEELIAIYMNDHNQRISFIDSIDKTLHEMANLKQLISDKKKYGSKIAELTDLKFSNDIQTNLMKLQEEVKNSEDKTKFNNDAKQGEFENYYHNKFTEIVKEILETRLKSLKKNFLDHEMKIGDFMASNEIKDLLKHRDVTKKGFVEVIDRRYIG